MRGSVTTALATMILSAAAHADWMHGVNPDAFNGDSYYAVTGDFSNAAGFNCTQDSTTPELVFVLPDKVTDTTTEMLKSSSLQLVVIVDSDPKVNFAAELGLTPEANNYRISATATEVLPLLAKVRDAKKRFGVGLQINGKIAEQHTFDVEGSGTAIRFIEEKCDLTDLEAVLAKKAGENTSGSLQMGDDKPKD